MPKIQTSSSVCFHLQPTLGSVASSHPAAVPDPAAPVEVATVNGVDLEKAKQLTQAVAEQVRSLVGSLNANVEFTFYAILFRIAVFIIWNKIIEI